MRLARFCVTTARAAVLIVATSIHFSAGGTAQAQDSTGTRPAYPDSLDGIPHYGYTDTTRVTTKPLTLREIIARCVEGEKTKLGGHESMTYTMTERVIVSWDKKREITEVVYRGYDDNEGTSRAVKLDEMVRHYKRDGEKWRLDQDKDKDPKDAKVSVEVGGHSDFTEIPFFLEEQKEFDFTLLDRVLEVDHVIFKIGFKPKSDFKALPSGTVYVDTNNYRIIHEEFTFDRNPLPLFFKDVKRLSRQWTELPGGEWVFTKVMLDLDIRSDPFGWVPENVAVAFFRDDFEFDVGYDERLFGER